MLFGITSFAQTLAPEDREDYKLYLSYCDEIVSDTIEWVGHGEYAHKTVVRADIVRPGLDTIKAGTVNYFFTKYVWYKCDCKNYKENDPKTPVLNIDLSTPNVDVTPVVVNLRTFPRLPKNAVRLSKQKVCQIPRRKASIVDYYAIRKSFQYLAWKDINKSLIFNSH
jgi:hypothetical protein